MMPKLLTLLLLLSVTVWMCGAKKHYDDNDQHNYKKQKNDRDYDNRRDVDDRRRDVDNHRRDVDDRRRDVDDHRRDDEDDDDDRRRDDDDHRRGVDDHKRDFDDRKRGKDFDKYHDKRDNYQKNDKGHGKQSDRHQYNPRKDDKYDDNKNKYDDKKDKYDDNKNKYDKHDRDDTHGKELEKYSKKRDQQKYDKPSKKHYKQDYYDRDFDGDNSIQEFNPNDIDPPYRYDDRQDYPPRYDKRHDNFNPKYYQRDENEFDTPGRFADPKPHKAYKKEKEFDFFGDTLRKPFPTYGYGEFPLSEPSPPPPSEVAKMARYVVHEAEWLSLATESSRQSTFGFPFSNILSTSDGPLNKSSGVPFFYMTPLDLTAVDLTRDNRCSVTISLAETDFCKNKSLDPEDPRCARVILTGRMKNINPGTKEAEFAQEALFTRHPVMKTWPADHHWFFAKMKIHDIVVLDYFGGPKAVSLADYFNATPGTIELLQQLREIKFSFYRP